MRLYVAVTSIILTVGVAALSQQMETPELARLLADPTTQQSAVERIVSSESHKVPLLLAWSRNAPSGLNEVEQHFFRVGMADVFGMLKVKAAMPFLIQNIALCRRLSQVSPIWMKTAPAVERQMPAVRALIQIGPEAAKAIIRAYQDPMMPEDRLFAVFVVSRIASSTKDPEIRLFLSTVLGTTELERFYAEEGMKFQDRPTSPK